MCRNLNPNVVGIQHTHTHTTILRLCGFCPGQPRWVGTRRNIHPLTLIHGHQSSLSAFSIYYDPWHPPDSIHVLYSLFHNLSPSFLWSTSWPGTLHFILQQFWQIQNKTDFRICLRQIWIYISLHKAVIHQLSLSIVCCIQVNKSTSNGTGIFRSIWCSVLYIIQTSINNYSMFTSIIGPSLVREHKAQQCPGNMATTTWDHLFWSLSGYRSVTSHSSAVVNGCRQSREYLTRLWLLSTSCHRM